LKFAFVWDVGENKPKGKENQMKCDVVAKTGIGERNRAGKLRPEERPIKSRGVEF